MISAGLPASSLSQFARRYRYFQEEKTRHVGIIKLTIHTITGMWVSIVLFKLMTNGWSGFYFQCCVLSLVFLTVSWLLSGEWLAGKSKAEPSRSTLLSFTRYAFLKRAKRCSTTTKKTGTSKLPALLRQTSRPHAGTYRVLRARTGTMTDNQRQHAENKGQRGHQDWA